MKCTVKKEYTYQYSFISVHAVVFTNTALQGLDQQCLTSCKDASMPKSLS